MSDRFSTKPTCFVVSSFADSFDDVFDAVHESVALLGYECLRADTIPHADEITSVIHDSIRQAAFVVADLTDFKANVYYEVGFARGLGKPVILICKEGSQVEFDLRNVNRINYATYRQLKEQLRSRTESVIGAARPAIDEQAADAVAVSNNTTQDLLALYASKIDKAKTDQSKVDALISRARVYSSIKLVDQAIEDIVQALVLAPEDPQLFIELGYVYNGARRFEEAIQVLKKAQQSSVSDSKAYTHEAFALNGLGRYPEAIETADKALSIAPNDSAAKRAREYAMQQVSHPPEILAPIASIPEDQELTVDSMSLSAQSYYAQGQHQLALDILGRAIQKYGSAAVLYEERGRILNLTGRRGEALAEFQTAASLDPNKWQIHYEVGQLYIALGRVGEGLVSYRKALSLSLDDSNALVQIGFTFSKAGDNATALEVYNRALNLNPNHVVAYINRGFAYNITGQHELALADYDKAIKINPRSPTAHIQRGYTLVGLGRLTEARASVEEGLRYDPSNKQGSKILTTILGRLGSPDS